MHHIILLVEIEDRSIKACIPESVNAIISFSLFMNPEAIMKMIYLSYNVFKHAIENKRKQRMYP